MPPNSRSTRRTPLDRGKISDFSGPKVLLLAWLDDDLGVIQEIRKVERAFPIDIPFRFECRLIPSKTPEQSLTGVFDKYMGPTSLPLYICYAGHAKYEAGKMILFPNK
jgi:hypothetical protein